MKVTCEIKDYSEPAQPNIKVHNVSNYKDRMDKGSMVELEVDGKRYVVKGRELKGAIDKCLLKFGEE